MKNTFIGLFCFFLGVAGFSLQLKDATAQIGGRTYQRVKAGTSPEGVVTTEVAKQSGKIEAGEGGRFLTIGEDLELTFPLGLKECRVFDSRSLEKAVLRAIWKGECEWIVLRPPSDWEPSTPLWLQLDKPLVLEDKSSASRGKPLVITNDTGRAIVFRAPKNSGCTVIMRKPDVAILGFTFEGAVCR